MALILLIVGRKATNEQIDLCERKKERKKERNAEAL